MWFLYVPVLLLLLLSVVGVDGPFVWRGIYWKCKTWHHALDKTHADVVF